MTNLTKLFLVLVGLNLGLATHADTLTVNSNPSYLDERIIPTNIVRECIELGPQLASFTKQYMEKKGQTVVLDGASEPAEQGRSLILTLTNATSIGNAFMGHRKSVTIEAILYEDGVEIDHYRGSRDSGGGFGAGFKGSCSVLGRCVKTLGKDVANWYNKKHR
ncbi:MAG: hypothetical protein ACI96M_002213 [Candidatus Azotimanducaceae bacterium]|jgi:hypothetical protein